jgi:hypothetical protein
VTAHLSVELPGIFNFLFVSGLDAPTGAPSKRCDQQW